MPRHSPLKVNPLPVSAFTPEAADDPWEGSRDSAFGMPLYSMGEEPVTMAMDQRNTILISHLVPPSKVLREVGGS